MRVGILSDSHDHVWNLRVALQVLADQADVLVHCGDFCSPFIVPILARFPGPVHGIFGNNDGDRWRLRLQTEKTPNVRLHGETMTTEFGGRRFAVHHFDDVARELAATRHFEVVCFGHNHRHEIGELDGCRLINPGSILGYRPSDSQDVEATFVVLNTESDELVTWHVAGGSAAPRV